MDKRLSFTVLVLACIPFAACLNVRAPDVKINSSPPPEQNDTSRVPDTGNPEDARRELAKAYREIDYLRAENDSHRRKIDELRRERDEYKDKYKQLKDRYDD